MKLHDTPAEAFLLLLGTGLWLGLLILLLGHLLHNACKRVGRWLEAVAEFITPCIVGCLVGVPLWQYDAWWLGMVAL
jgi:hypothetical protein